MTTERFNFYILILCVFICGFIYFDSYLIPTNSIRDIVVDKKYFEQHGQNGLRNTYELMTKRNDFDVTASAYNSLLNLDTIMIEKSKLTNSIQKIIVERNNEKFIYEVGFIRARSGMIFCPMICLFILLSIIFNSKLSKRKDKNLNPYFSLIISLIILSYHIGVEYYFK